MGVVKPLFVKNSLNKQFELSFGGSDIPDFPTPSFPKTTERMFFKLVELFTLSVRGFVGIS